MAPHNLNRDLEKKKEPRSPNILEFGSKSSLLTWHTTKDTNSRLRETAGHRDPELAGQTFRAYYCSLCQQSLAASTVSG